MIYTHIETSLLYIRMKFEVIHTYVKADIFVTTERKDKISYILRNLVRPGNIIPCESPKVGRKYILIKLS